jgi:hypothetical protein
VRGKRLTSGMKSIVANILPKVVKMMNLKDLWKDESESLFIG